MVPEDVTAEGTPHQHGSPFLPFSRFNPQFNREALSGAISAEGFRYVFPSGELGGRPTDLARGRVRYERARSSDSFRRGLIRVVDGARKHRIALMCTKKEPLDCHRSLKVAAQAAEENLEWIGALRLDPS